MTTLLSLDQVGVTFGDKIILANISLSLYSGKIVTLLGPNGAGKSTLAKIILGLVAPSSGKVLIEPSLRIGYVPQSLHLESTFPLSVERFILLKKNAKKSEIPALLERVKAAHLQHKAMQQLSGGELQRVLLAQAILDKPQLLVLDEPAQGLDMNGQVLLYNLVEELRQELGCGVLMISHDLFLVMAKTDEVICLNKEICCSGTPLIVAQSNAFTSMFNIQEDQVLALYQHHHCVPQNL